MTVSLVIQDFEQLSQSGAYGGMRRLSPQTELMLISLYMYSSLYRWSNDNGAPLTAEQIDTIDNWTAIAQNELMEEVSGVPLGCVIACYTDEIPDGFLLCDGAVYQKSAYPELYDVLVPQLQITATTFRTPNAFNRVQRGTDNPNNSGLVLGNNTVTLTSQNLPPHSHGYNIAAGGIPVAPAIGALALSAVAPTSTTVVGSGTPFSIIQPIVMTRFIIAYR